MCVCVCEGGPFQAWAARASSQCDAKRDDEDETKSDMEAGELHEHVTRSRRSKPETFGPAPKGPALWAGVSKGLGPFGRAQRAGLKGLGPLGWARRVRPFAPLAWPKGPSRLGTRVMLQQIVITPPINAEM